MNKRGKEDLVKLYRIPEKEDLRSNYCKLIGVILLASVFISLEIVGGIISHSISVISDATHLITDVIGFVLSFVALYYSRKRSNTKNSFGFHRVEIIGAVINLFTIWSIAVYLLFQASMRIYNRDFVQNPKIMLIVAVGGLIVNLLMFSILHSGGGHSHGVGQKCSHELVEEQVEQKLCQTCNEPQGEFHRCDSVSDIVGTQPAQCQVDHHHSDTCKKILISPESKSHKHTSSCNHGGQSKAHDHAHEQAHDHDHDSHQGHKHEDGHKHGQGCEGHGKTPSVSDVALKDQSCSKQHKNGHQHDHNHQHKHDDHGHSHSHDQAPHDHTNMSMKAAVLHVITDIIQSVGLVISSIFIYYYGSDTVGGIVTEFNNWHYLDPVTTYVFSILVLFSTYPISKECYQIILEATPSEIDSDKIQQAFLAYPEVKQIHDFHIWSLRPGKVLLTAHVFSAEGEQKYVLERLTIECRKKKIYHSTIQVQEWSHKNSVNYIKCENDIH